MPPRGNARRGRGNFKSSIQKNERESALNRLDKVIYPKTINDRNPRKYKFIRNQVANSCIVTLPVEAKVRHLAKSFLKSYYDIFDQAGRPNLESQYSADSFFSFSSTHPMPTVGRNLIEVREPAQRISMLVHGRTNIASALATFSPTEHLIDCLTIDVPYYIANPMSISFLKIVVTGVFKDTSQTTNPLRAFTRVIALKHTSTDKEGEPVYQIFNDLFMLQVPTPDQIKKYHHNAQAVKKFFSNQPTNSSANTSGELTLNDKERLIKSVMARTKMNRFGSTRLLEEREWNEEDSVEVFNTINSQGLIPQNYFTPS